MELNRLTERIWVYPYEEERDRPNLGYIRGDRWSLAVDAGHSAAHTRAFYGALEAAGLPLPRLTVLTHWHWDHTFGMHAAEGLCLANADTNRHLAEFRDRLAREGMGCFLSLHESIRREYADGKLAVITLADLVFAQEIRLDAGRCPVRVFRAEAPHTDDSTLIEVPGERMLFLGDAAGGPFPDHVRDPALCEKLAWAIRDSAADLCLEGHWIPQSRAETIRDLLEGD